nr:hypothetical protein [Ilumatobacter sp.]
MSEPAPANGFDVVVVGSLNLDLVVRTQRLPGPGETVSGSDYQEFPGGKGLNQAVAAARAGALVAFVGAVGDDDAVRRAEEQAAVVDRPRRRDRAAGNRRRRRRARFRDIAVSRKRTVAISLAHLEMGRVNHGED